MPTKTPMPAVTAPALSSAELATAFDGKLERVGVPLGYRIGVVLVAGAMILLPMLYFAIIAAAAWLVWWHMTHSVAMFEHVRVGRAVIFLGVIYIAPIIAGGVLILSMILPLFWGSKKGPRPMWVDRREQPLLYAYVEQLCDAMRVPRPHRIDVIADANASAHIDNGLFGLVHRRLVLTIGLPLANGMTLKQFTGVMAHEFGHFAQGSSMRLSYAVHRINLWFARMAWGRSGVDDVVDEMLQSEAHWSAMLVGLLCKTTVGVARLVLKALALLSHALSMHLSRQAEFDADRRAARVVGSVAMEDGLQMIPFISTAHVLAVEQARLSWSKRVLPDDLVTLTDMAHLRMPDKVKDSITSRILTAEASWFDTHPPLYKRVGALKKAKLQGVLKLEAPAVALFKDFGELSKMATIDFYQGVLGTALQPEHLFATTEAASPPFAKNDARGTSGPGGRR